MLDNTRHLATLATITNLRPIPDADSIEVGTVRGWDVVVARGDFSDGEAVIYIEPDAALPVTDPRFAFLAPRGTKMIDDEPYHVLKTIRLRGQLSQGIVFHASDFMPKADTADLDTALGIKLWEPPAPPVGADQIGPWDVRWLRKTDAERVQNLSDDWLAGVDDGLWVPTEKVDGTSLTFVLDDGRLRVYSRNWELSTADPESSPLQLARRHDLADWMRRHQVDALQGEMYGEGVNGNRLKIKGQRLALFAAWSRDVSRATDRFDILYDAATSQGLETAPRLDGLPFPRTVRSALAQADGMKSLVTPAVLAEGIVWHHPGERLFPELDYRPVFKAVANSYLLKHGL